MKYLKSLTLKMCVIAAALLLASPAVAANSNGRGTKVKTVYQDTDPSATNYLKNRRALVGPGCTVNSVGDGVKVLSGLKDPQNLCNDNLDDYASFPGLVDATVAASPVVSIKDNKHYYAKGTEAGFTICTSSEANILKVDVSTLYGIKFFKDGEAVSDVVAVKTGQNITGLGLSLLTIPGSNLVTKSFVAEAPADFDEVQLYRMGVEANVGGVLNIKYAFVGKAREYTITNNKENGIAKYAQEQGREPFTLEAHGDDPAKDGLLETSRGNLIDEDLTNYFTVSAVLKIGNSLPVTVVARPSDGKEAFPAGTEVGFKFNSTTALDLSIGNGASITLYDKNNKKIDTYTISATVLGLNVIKSDKNGELVLKAPKDFSAAKLQFPGVLDLKLGKDYVNYAFVRMAPDLATHHCPIEATASHNVCGCENEYQLQHSDKVNNITWSIVSQPADSNISLDTQTGKVTNIYAPGDYTFKATAADGCTETTTIHYAPYYDPAEHGVTLLTNNASETKYELSGNNGGALLQLFGGIDNASNVLNSSLNDYASVKAGVALVENTGIIGIKSVDKSALNKNIDKTHEMQAGFVVTFNSTVLDLKALNLYNIQLYKDGKKVAGGVATHWGAISAGLIGSENTQKMRMSIDVPAGTDFDEIVLFNSGVIDAKLAKPNIYYAYVCDDEMDNASNNALYGTELVSMDGTDASINWDSDKTNIFSVLNIGNGLNGISNLIDNSIETGLTFPLGVSANDAYVTVNVGKVVDKGQKIIMVSEDKELGLGVKLIKAIKLTTCLNGVDQEELTDWKVLGADVIGTGGKQYATLKPTKSFNQVRLTVVGGLNLADNIKVYGLALGSDINEDGTSTDCPEEFLVLDEDETLDDNRSLTKATMVFHRTFTTKKWNSLILPVDMTADQVKAAFGANAKIARFNRLEDKWIYFDMQAENNLHKNVPYIIKPTKEPTAVNRTYNVGGENTKHINGLVYTVTGIVYEGLPNLQQEDIKFTSGMTHYGSYTNPTVVPADSYILHRSGDMVHTAVEHKNIKSYRTWLRETTPSGETLQMRVEQNDGPSTGIKVIEETAKNANAVYNVNGMRMNSSNTDNLPKGVYIINNKKVVIK
jgi:hypothetical protein